MPYIEVEEERPARESRKSLLAKGTEASGSRPVGDLVLQATKTAAGLTQQLQVAVHQVVAAGEQVRAQRQQDLKLEGELAADEKKLRERDQERAENKVLEQRVVQYSRQLKTQAQASQKVAEAVAEKDKALSEKDRVLSHELQEAKKQVQQSQKLAAALSQKNKDLAEKNRALSRQLDEAKKEMRASNGLRASGSVSKRKTSKVSVEEEQIDDASAGADADTDADSDRVDAVEIAEPAHAEDTGVDDVDPNSDDPDADASAE